MRFEVSKKLQIPQWNGDYGKATRAAGHQLFWSGNNQYTNSADYVFSFQGRKRPYRAAAYETGFWHEAAHLDVRGLWNGAVFNQPGAMAQVLAYKAPISAQDVCRNRAGPVVKYSQPTVSRTWDGVVLACQVAHDHSITVGSNASEAAYWAFLEGACKHYGPLLFMKYHPRSHGPDLVRVLELAKKYGARAGPTDLKILEKCRFVLVYNSTFSVDAWMWGKRVAQFAEGYFANTGAVTYTRGQFPNACEDTDGVQQKLLNFLIWRYCYYRLMPADRMIAMFEAFAQASPEELFPLPEELSYAAQAPRKKNPT